MMDLDALKNYIDSSNKILVIQADNPDGDSLASSLALESLLEENGKKVVMYCGVEIPTYLRHISGWDRVVKNVPNNFDLAIIVDCSSLTLLENMQKNGEIKWLKTKPLIIIDHHNTPSDVDFSSLEINKNVSSTGELIYEIAKLNNWPITNTTAEYIAISILSDTLGLTTESVTYETVSTIAKLVRGGLSLAKLDEQRRQTNKKSLAIVKYKARLLERIDTSFDPRIATIHIPWDEIEKYSHEYNPSVLVLEEMRMIEGVQVAIAFKSYPDGKITAKIRSNYGFKVADKVAENFGGGGHFYASGFKINEAKPLNEVVSDCCKFTAELLDNLVME